MKYVSVNADWETKNKQKLVKTDFLCCQSKWSLSNYKEKEKNLDEYDLNEALMSLFLM